MDTETHAALLKSIEHWEKNVQRAQNGDINNLDITTSGCALCEKFFDGEHCVGCPVYEADHWNRRCRNTPYVDVSDMLEAYTEDNAPSEYTIKKFTNACQKELDFLKSLLPEEGE